MSRQSSVISDSTRDLQIFRFNARRLAAGSGISRRLFAISVDSAYGGEDVLYTIDNYGLVNFSNFLSSAIGTDRLFASRLYDGALTTSATQGQLVKWDTATNRNLVVLAAGDNPQLVVGWVVNVGTPPQIGYTGDAWLTLEAGVSCARGDVVTLASTPGQDGKVTTMTKSGFRLARATKAISAGGSGSFQWCPGYHFIDDSLGAPTFALSAAGTTRTCTIQLKCVSGVNVASLSLGRVWVSDAAGGALVGTECDGAVTATTGTILETIVAKKDFDIISDASGVIVLSLTHEGGAKTVYVNAVVAGKVYSSAAVLLSA